MADTEEPNMSYLTDAQIEEGLRLCAAATPGPWFSTDAPAVGLKFYVAACSDHTQPIVAECREIDAEADRLNAIFIAAARTDLPRALEANRRYNALAPIARELAEAVRDMEPCGADHTRWLDVCVICRRMKDALAHYDAEVSRG